MKVRWPRQIAALFGYELIRRRKLNDTIEDHLRNVFDLHGINCVVDVGANVGQYGQLLRRAGYQGRIVSFEPLSSVFTELVNVTRGDPNWRTVQAALSDSEGTITMNEMASTEFSSISVPTAYGSTRFDKAMQVTGREQVRMTTLATVWPEIVEDMSAPKVFLKLDTQGHDLAVLDGARSVVSEILGVQVELSFKPLYEGTPDFLTVLDRFRQEDFGITGLFVVSRDKATLEAIEYDCVMTRRRG